jgi:outer membrane lipoprotein-sorting protein
MMRILIVFLLSFPFYLPAQENSDKKSKELLSELSKKYRGYTSIKADFTILIEDPRDQSSVEQKGTLFLKGKKYKIQIEGQDVISDGQTRWTFLKDANEVQIDNQKTEEHAITPSNIFTMYEKGWKSKYAGEQKVKNVSYQVIELVPLEGKSRNIFKVKLFINKLQKTIASARILDRNGTTQTITVDKFVPDGAASDSLYVFNTSAYPGSEVIDLR